MSDERPAKKESSDTVEGSILGISGIVDGVSNLLGKLGELAEKAESFSKSQGESPSGKKIAGSYGFTVKVAGGDRSDSDVAPIRKVVTPSAAKPQAEVPKERDFHLEVFDEGEHLLVVAEMPGVGSDDVKLVFSGDQLRITAESKYGPFVKVVSLPKCVETEHVTIESNNGIVEITLPTMPDAT